MALKRTFRIILFLLKLFPRRNSQETNQLVEPNKSLLDFNKNSFSCAVRHLQQRSVQLCAFRLVNKLENLSIHQPTSSRVFFYLWYDWYMFYMLCTTKFTALAKVLLSTHMLQQKNSIIENINETEGNKKLFLLVSTVMSDGAKSVTLLNRVWQ